MYNNSVSSNIAANIVLPDVTNTHIRAFLNNLQREHAQLYRSAPIFTTQSSGYLRLVHDPICSDLSSICFAPKFVAVSDEDDYTHDEPDELFKNIASYVKNNKQNIVQKFIFKHYYNDFDSYKQMRLDYLSGKIYKNETNGELHTAMKRLYPSIEHESSIMRKRAFDMIMLDTLGRFIMYNDTGKFGCTYFAKEKIGGSKNIGNNSSGIHYTDTELLYLALYIDEVMH